MKDLRLRQLQGHIKVSWDTLTRSNAGLGRADNDPHLGGAEVVGDPRLLYVSRLENKARVEGELRKQLGPDFRDVRVEVLPQDVTRAFGRDPGFRHGLLYLPNPYVVPGGRFDEMYGWDSYFIVLGLLRDGRVDLARGMVDNFFYQIKHYGKILNANRSYYLSRSQPPFLTGMVLAVHRAAPNRRWLEQAVPYIEATYKFWTTGDHLTEATGLSRYYDQSDAPAPEVVGSRDDQEKRQYDQIAHYFKTRDLPEFEEARYYDRARGELTPFAYRNDRSMRESGFDTSDRFGRFNLGIVDYNPVCLNSLLYLMEDEMATILKEELGRAGDADRWQERARTRRDRINKLMWDEQAGLYYDFDVVRNKRRRYPFITTFYPLWAGIADPGQAARVLKNLGLFERPGGLQTSADVTGRQWDAPFGWAPMQLIAVRGLRRYGFTGAADRVSANFLSMVLKEYLLSRTVVEKYNVLGRDSRVAGIINTGYRENVVGFGWTNGVFSELYAELSGAARAWVLDLGGQPVPK